MKGLSREGSGCITLAAQRAALVEELEDMRPAKAQLDIAKAELHTPKAVNEDTPAACNTAAHPFCCVEGGIRAPTTTSAH